ncbi:MAG: tetratricopeptide repeat protein, partial [Alphaproteobacteria bacterium]
HIAGGHLAQSRDELSKASVTTVIATLLGAAAAAGGALSGSPEAANIGVAIMQGGRQIARRAWLRYARGQESVADQAAARYLRATGQSSKGMLTMFSRLADQLLVSVRNIDPYAISHPLPRERISLLERLARDSPYFNDQDPAKLQLRHDMMLAKLLAFTGRPDRVFRRYKTNSLPARYARAIALYRSADLRRAIKAIDALIASNPKYPYFWELKGQALLEAGKARQAVPVLKKAVALAPRAALIRILFAQALLQTNNPALLATAIAELKKALVTERRSPFAYRQLAMAYGKAGDKPRAELASAQEFLVRGDLRQAKRFAKRAAKKLKTGTRDWLIADDILKISGR